MTSPFSFPRKAQATTSLSAVTAPAMSRTRSSSPSSSKSSDCLRSFVSSSPPSTPTSSTSPVPISAPHKKTLDALPTSAVSSPTPSHSISSSSSVPITAVPVIPTAPIFVRSKRALSDEDEEEDQEGNLIIDCDPIAVKKTKTYIYRADDDAVSVAAPIKSPIITGSIARSKRASKTKKVVPPTTRRTRSSIAETITFDNPVVEFEDDLTVVPNTRTTDSSASATACIDDEPIVEYEEDEPVVSTTTLDTDIDTIYCYTVGNASAKRSRSEEEEEIESVIVPTKKTRKSSPDEEDCRLLTSVQEHEYPAIVPETASIVRMAYVSKLPAALPSSSGSPRSSKDKTVRFDDPIEQGPTASTSPPASPKNITSTHASPSRHSLVDPSKKSTSPRHSPMKRIAPRSPRSRSSSPSFPSSSLIPAFDIPRHSKNSHSSNGTLETSDGARQLTFAEAARYFMARTIAAAKAEEGDIIWSGTGEYEGYGHKIDGVISEFTSRKR